MLLRMEREVAPQVEGCTDGKANETVEKVGNPISQALVQEVILCLAAYTIGFMIPVRSRAAAMM